MSSYDNSRAQFYINSTISHLNCTKFDIINYGYLTYEVSKGENHTLRGYYNYSCSAYLPGSTNDVALHYQPPKKSARNLLSKAEKVVGISISSRRAVDDLSGILVVGEEASKVTV